MEGVEEERGSVWMVVVGEEVREGHAVVAVVIAFVWRRRKGSSGGRERESVREEETAARAPDRHNTRYQ